MSTPENPLPPSMAEVASEPAAESVDRERDVVGDQPDLGGLVPGDNAQSEPEQ